MRAGGTEGAVKRGFQSFHFVLDAAFSSSDHARNPFLQRISMYVRLCQTYVFTDTRRVLTLQALRRVGQARRIPTMEITSSRAPSAIFDPAMSALPPSLHPTSGYRIRHVLVLDSFAKPLKGQAIEKPTV